MWVTTSLRGLVGGTLRVDILDEGIHSGEASGVVPSSFRIARHLLEGVGGDEISAAVADMRNNRLIVDKRNRGQGRLHSLVFRYAAAEIEDVPVGLLHRFLQRLDAIRARN